MSATAATASSSFNAAAYALALPSDEPQDAATTVPTTGPMQQIEDARTATGQLPPPEWTGVLATDVQLIAQNAAASGPTPTQRLVNTVGADFGPSLRRDAAAQLSYEAALNAQHNPGYARDLVNLANVAATTNKLVDGSYVRADNRVEFLRPEDRINPLSIRPFTGDAVARVAQYNRDIDALQPYTNLPYGAGQAAAARQQALRVERDAFINDARLQSSARFDGQAFLAQADSADPTRVPVIFVNGINTDVTRSRAQALELSDAFRAPVLHVVNVSSKDLLVSTGLRDASTGLSNQGFDAPLLEQRLQQVTAANARAAFTTANAILNQLTDPALQNTPVKIVAYSQGGPITQDALRMVDSTLGRWVDTGRITEAQRDKMLGRIQLLGLGPAAGHRNLTQDYVRDRGRADTYVLQQRPELSQVRYSIVVDQNDQIGRAAGVMNAQPDVLQTVDALRRLAGNDFHAHLSYFRSYEAMDPGSTYNSAEVGPLLQQWYANRRDNPLPPITITDVPR